MKHAAGLLLLVLLLPSLGCDKATPVAPGGTILTLSANPTRIGLNGSSTITIVGRKPDGNPLNPGTEIRLTTDLGTIEPLVTVDNQGRATATLRADGRFGPAKVTAAAADASVETTVQIGEAARSIVLQPTPTTIPETGGTIQLLATIRDASGLPLPNQGVNFTTDVGRLTSRGAIVQTNGNGQARDTLNVAEEDLAGNVSTISVGAQTAGTDGALISASFSVRVQGGRPEASFEFVKISGREYQFTDTSTGGIGQLTYSWNFDDGSAPSPDKNPRHTFSADDAYAVVLTVTDSADQSDTATAVITVPTDTSGSG